MNTYVQPFVSMMLAGIPGQNREDGDPPPAGSPPPGSQIPIPQPSGDTIQQENIDEVSFFKNRSYKSEYFKVHKKLANLINSSSRINFLQSCINFKILPPNSKIKCNHNPRFSQEASKIFTENLEFISFENLKIGLREERLYLKKCKLELKKSKIHLHSLILEPNLHVFFNTRLAQDKLVLSKQAVNKHKQKLIFLFKKENRPLPSHLKTSLTNEESKQKKKNRKFIKRNRYRKLKKKIDRKMQLPLVTNFSDIEVTKDMESLLNKGLNYAIVPKTINTTQIIAGFERMGRTMNWMDKINKEKESNEERELDLSLTDNFIKVPWKPTNIRQPQGTPTADLTTFLNGSLSCVLGSDLKKTHRNLPVNERAAMDKLVSLQKSRVITIKPMDKMGGVAILNTPEYISGMEQLLKAEFKDENGTNHLYFRTLEAVEADQLQFNHLEELKDIVRKGRQRGWIGEDEAKWLVPDHFSPGRLYGLVKDHVDPAKWPAGGKIPPLRPVESASGTTFENSSHFVDYHSNHLVKDIPSFIEDTPDLLRFIESENQKGPQPAGCVPVTLDVTALYTNIPIDEGMHYFQEFLDKREDKTVPTAFLITLLGMVLSCNILTFDNKFYWQEVGVAMGTRVAPTFANIFMSVIEGRMLRTWRGQAPAWYRRFIDDCIMLWTGSEVELLNFLEHINNIHPLIKFKASYDFQSKKVEFLDTVISITEQGFIKTSLFTKPGKKCTYLLPSSCHPGHITQNIPYSLALRLKRICSDNLDFLAHLDILQEKLLGRGYKQNFIVKAFEKVSNLPRATALIKTEKNPVKRVVLSLQFDPRLPNISNILFRFWKVMIQNPHLKRTFPDPPMICWSRPKNLRDFLIKAQLPPVITERRSSRVKNGFSHCGRNCKMCHNSPRFCKSVINTKTNEIFPILSTLDCTSKNVIYLITCRKNSGSCAVRRPQYVGQTSRMISSRFNEHSHTIRTGSTTVGSHFKAQGHNLQDLEIVPIEKIRSTDPWIRLAREKLLIRSFDSALNKIV